jgi:ATP-binding cassette subfamily B protein
MIDEALTALDPATETKIIGNLRTKFPEASFLIISHRASVFKHVDNIFILEDGKFLKGYSFENVKDSEAFNELFMSMK